MEQDGGPEKDSVARSRNRQKSASGSDQPLTAGECRIHQQRQRSRRQCSGKNHPGVRERQPGGNEIPQASGSYEGGEGGGTHIDHGSGPDTGHDNRGGQGQAHMSKYLSRRHAQSPSSADSFRRGIAYPGLGVPENWL
jgi:hypothetical protein